METRANYALIGAFTLSVIAAAFAFVFWFSRGDKPANSKVYRVVFTSSVSGLSRGANVNFNGLRVGEVTKIDLADNPSIVYALVEIDPRTPVKKDTRARLEFQGLTGVASVALTGGTAASADLNGTRDEPAQIIADRSDFQNIVETLQNLSLKLDTMLDRTDRLLGDNAASISNTIKNVEAFSKSLADNSGGIQDFVAALSDAGKSIKPFLETLERNSGNFDQILKDTRELIGRLNAAASKIDNLLGSKEGPGVVDEIGETAKSLRKLADHLDERTRDLTANLKQFTGPGLRNYEALAVEGRRTLDEVNRTLRSLQRNPQQLIFGSKPDLPEYSGR